MTTITLQPIAIRFECIEDFDIEDYIEYCEDYDIQPSQKHYKEWAFDCMVESLTDDIDTDKFVISYGNSKKIEYSETKVEEPAFNYGNFVSDLTEEELEEFHNLSDKMIIHPHYCEKGIVVMNSSDNLSLFYGTIITSDGDISYMKKSSNAHHLFSYLKNYQDTL